jgi:hypothetical protein
MLKVVHDADASHHNSAAGRSLLDEIATTEISCDTRQPGKVPTREAAVSDLPVSVHRVATSAL